MNRRFFLLSLVVLFGFGLNGCGYNTIQKNDEAVIAAWGDVEASYQRRADLIPNLVEVVKGYAAHEKEGSRSPGRPRRRWPPSGGCGP